MRLVWLALFLAVLFLAIAAPFLLRADDPALLFTEAGARALLHGAGTWAWLAALGLLVGDLLFPVPATAVMSALGYLYGVWLGGLIGSIGSVGAGAVAYGLCRALGRGAAVRLVGQRDLERGHRLFERAGGWVVALSRWLPILPEVISCLAGLTRMPFPRFLAATACGSIPMAFTFAAVGRTGVDHPGLALALSAGAPVLLWAFAGHLLKRGGRP